MNLYYENNRLTLTEKDCQQLQDRSKDAFGMPWPYPGHYTRPIGVREYNGGCIREGTWYPGESFLEPVLPLGWKLIHIPTWGWHVVPEGFRLQPRL